MITTRIRRAILCLVVVVSSLCSISARAETLEAMDAVVARAKDLDEFLSRADLVEAYYEAATKYYGADKFPRGHFNQIMAQVRGMAASVPGFKERAWDTTASGTSFSIASEAPTFARNLDSDKWESYKDAKIAALRTAATGVADLAGVNEAFRDAERKIAEFDTGSLAGGRRARGIMQAEFYRRLFADPKLQAASAYVALHYLESEKAKRTFATENPDLILNLFREIGQHPEKMIAEIPGVEPISTRLANPLKKVLPTSEELLSREVAVFPPKMVRGKEGTLIPMEPGKAAEYHFKVAPRRFHGAFKGIPAGECVGGGCTFSEFYGTPERWAANFLKDAQLHFLEVGGKYQGFIQQVPLQGPDGIVATVDYGTQILRQGMMRRRADGSLGSVTLFSAWLHEADRLKPEGWKGFLKNAHYSFNNSGVVPAILTSAEFLTADKTYQEGQLKHIDPMAADIVRHSPSGTHRDSYRGNMITESTIKSAGVATVLKPGESDLPGLFKRAFDRGDTKFVNDTIKTMAGEGYHLFKFENFLIQLRDTNLLSLFSRQGYRFTRQKNETGTLQAMLPHLLAAGFTPTELRWVRDFASWGDGDAEAFTKDVLPHLDGPEQILEFLGSPKQHPTPEAKARALLVAKQLAPKFFHGKPGAEHFTRFMDVVKSVPDARAVVEAAEKKMREATKTGELLAAYGEAAGSKAGHLAGVLLLHRYADRIKDLAPDRDALGKSIAAVGGLHEHVPMALIQELQRKLAEPWTAELRKAIDEARTGAELAELLVKTLEGHAAPHFAGLAPELERGALKLRRLGAAPHDVHRVWDSLAAKTSGLSIPTFLGLQRMRWRVADTSARWLEVVAPLTTLDKNYLPGINANIDVALTDFLRLNPTPKEVAALLARAPHGWPTPQTMQRLLEIELSRAKTKAEYSEVVDQAQAVRDHEGYRTAATAAIARTYDNLVKLGGGPPEIARLITITKAGADSDLARRLREAFRAASGNPEKLVEAVEAVLTHSPASIVLVQNELENAVAKFHAAKPRPALYERMSTALANGRQHADWPRMETLLLTQLLYADTYARYATAATYYHQVAAGQPGPELMKRLTDRTAVHLATLRASPKEVYALVGNAGTHFGTGAAATVLATKLRASQSAAEYFALLGEGTKPEAYKKTRAQAMAETLDHFIGKLDATADLVAKTMSYVEGAPRERLQERWKVGYARDLREAKDAASFVAAADAAFTVGDPVLAAFATKVLPEVAEVFHRLNPDATQAKKVYDRLAAVDAPEGVLARGAFATTATQYIDFVAHFREKYADATIETLKQTMEHFLRLKPPPGEIERFLKNFPPQKFGEAPTVRAIEWRLAAAESASAYHVALAALTKSGSGPEFAAARHQAIEKTISHYDALGPTIEHDLQLDLALKSTGGPLHEQIAGRWRGRARAALAAATTPAALISAVDEVALAGQGEHVLPIIGETIARFPGLAGAGDAEFSAMRAALAKINPATGTAERTELNRQILVATTSAKGYLDQLPPARDNAPGRDKEMIEKIVGATWEHFIALSPTAAEVTAFQKMAGHVTLPTEIYEAVLTAALSRAATPDAYLEAMKWPFGSNANATVSEARRRAIEKTQAHFETLSPWIKHRIRLSHEAENSQQADLEKSWKEKFQAHLGRSPTAQDFVERVEEALAKDLPHANAVAEIVMTWTNLFARLRPDSDQYRRVRERLALAPDEHISTHARLRFTESPAAYLAETRAIGAARPPATRDRGVTRTIFHFLLLGPTHDHVRETTQLAEAGHFSVDSAIEVFVGSLADTKTTEEYVKLVESRAGHGATGGSIIDAAVARTMTHLFALPGDKVFPVMKLVKTVGQADLKILLQKTVIDRGLVKNQHDYIVTVILGDSPDAALVGKNAKLIAETYEKHFFVHGPTPQEAQTIELAARDPIVRTVILNHRMRGHLESPEAFLSALGDAPSASLAPTYETFLRSQLPTVFFAKHPTAEQVLKMKTLLTNMPPALRAWYAAHAVPLLTNAEQFATIFEMSTNLSAADRAQLNAVMRNHMTKFFALKPSAQDRALASQTLGGLSYFSAYCGFKFF